MSDLSDLYQEIILDHNKHPRNFGKIENATRKAEGVNPLCGDQLTVYLKMKGERAEEISFEGKGCAISKASASVMTDTLKGKTAQEVEALFSKFHDFVTGEGDKEADMMIDGEMAALSGVRQFPVRVKCATLAWHTVRSALQGKDETVSTE